MLSRNPYQRQENIRIQSQKKIIESSIYSLSWYRIFTKKMHSCKNNLENSYTEKKPERKNSGWATIVKWTFDATKDSHGY